jgi:hypothetical protein
MSTRISLLAAAAFAIVGLAGMSASEAMPFAALDQAQAETSIVTTTAQGCGWWDHRGPYGHCRPLYSCPPGWHTGPFGRHCHRNW